MAGPRSLVWLASYPKSGNTWLRAFLANYFIESDEPVSINEMQKVSFGDVSRPSYAELAGGNPDRLPIQALMKVRHAHLSRIAAGAPVNFVKTHYAHAKIGGAWAIPAELTKCAIYLVRDPLDMLISYADHWGLSPERAAMNIASPQNNIPPSPKTVAQFLGTWSEHVRGWTRTRDFRVLVLRYEDLLAAPEENFARVLRHIGAPMDEEALAQAVFFSSFDMLAGQEAEQGFTERGPAQERFFRQGTAGQGRALLPPEVVERVERDHGQAMKRHGYL